MGDNSRKIRFGLRIRYCDALLVVKGNTTGQRFNLIGFIKQLINCLNSFYYGNRISQLKDNFSKRSQILEVVDGDVLPFCLSTCENYQHEIFVNGFHFALIFCGHYEKT